LIKGPTNDFFERTAYTLSYDRRNRIANWVGEHITAQSIAKGEGVSRSKSNFRDDQAIPALFRARTRDYVKTGYDRGHLCPADDADATQESLQESFSMSNMAPQIGIGFNRHCKCFFFYFKYAYTHFY
jgi:endonuclease G